MFMNAVDVKDHLKLSGSFLGKRLSVIRERSQFCRRKNSNSVTRESNSQLFQTLKGESGQSIEANICYRQSLKVKNCANKLMTCMHRFHIYKYTCNCSVHNLANCVKQNSLHAKKIPYRIIFKQNCKLNIFYLNTIFIFNYDQIDNLTNFVHI